MQPWIDHWIDRFAGWEILRLATCLGKAHSDKTPRKGIFYGNFKPGIAFSKVAMVKFSLGELASPWVEKDSNCGMDVHTPWISIDPTFWPWHICWIPLWDEDEAPHSVVRNRSLIFHLAYRISKEPNPHSGRFRTWRPISFIELHQHPPLELSEGPSITLLRKQINVPMIQKVERSHAGFAG